MTGVKGRRWGANVYVDTAIAVGSLFYVDSNHVLQPLAPGTSGDFLKTNGTGAAPSWGTPSGVGGGGSGALVLLESHTASASASLDFTTRNATGQSGATIQSDYDEYIVEVLNIVTASNTQLGWRMSTNGGSSYDSGSNYEWQAGFAYSGSDGRDGTTATRMDWRNTSTTINANTGYNGTFRLVQPGSSLWKPFYGNCFVYDSSIGMLTFHWSGIYKSTTAVNAFQLIAASGNLTSGTVRAYGVAK